jgi:hypothetical protein
VRTRRKADKNNASERVAECRHRLPPIVVIAISPPLFARDRFAIGNELGTPAACDYPALYRVDVARLRRHEATFGMSNAVSR